MTCSFKCCWALLFEEPGIGNRRRQRAESKERLAKRIGQEAVKEAVRIIDSVPEPKPEEPGRAPPCRANSWHSLHEDASGDWHEDARVSDSHEVFSGQYALQDTVLGKGMNGSVKLASLILDPEALFAVKIISKTIKKRELVIKMAEVDIYIQMDHPNIAKLIRVFDEPADVYLVMEFCSGGSLHDRLLNQGCFPEPLAAYTVKQMLAALRYCHGHTMGRLCHCDLKPSNFLYDTDSQDATLKLIDFGVSCVLQPDIPKTSGSYGGTKGYMAPEVILQQPYNEKCDLWSVGVITAMLLTRELPFEGRTTQEVAAAAVTHHLVSMDSSIWSHVGDRAKEFITLLLRADADERPSAEQASQHDWLTATDTSCLEPKQGSAFVPALCSEDTTTIDGF